MIWLDKPKENLQHSLSLHSYKFIVVSHSHADSVAVHSNDFLLFEWLYDGLVLLNGNAVTQNYDFVVFESEATKNNSHD